MYCSKSSVLKHAGRWQRMYSLGTHRGWFSLDNIWGLQNVSSYRFLIYWRLWNSLTIQVNENQLRPPVQKNYDPCDGLKDMLEINLVGPLPTSIGFTQILMAADIFSYLFTVPLKRRVHRWWAFIEVCIVKSCWLFVISESGNLAFWMNLCFD